MVYFTCEECSEALKKNQVQKHALYCMSDAYSCVDCQKCFSAESSAGHLRCITEDQKYGGSGYVQKRFKGEEKQNSWLEQVLAAITNVSNSDPKLKSVLVRIKQHTNIPRKEAKFVNFLQNSMKVNQKALCLRAWDAIQAEVKKADGTTAKNNIKDEDDDVVVVSSDKAGANNSETQANQQEDVEDNGGDTIEYDIMDDSSVVNTEDGPENVVEQQPASANESNGLMGRKSNSDTRQANSNGTSISNVETEQQNKKFKWKSAIKRKLRECDGNTMKFKRLRDSVIDEYLARRNGELDRELLETYFADRLAAASGVSVNGKVVSLEE